METASCVFRTQTWRVVQMFCVCDASSPTAWVSLTRLSLKPAGQTERLEEEDAASSSPCGRSYGELILACISIICMCVCESSCMEADRWSTGGWQSTARYSVPNKPVNYTQYPLIKKQTRWIPPSLWHDLCDVIVCPPHRHRVEAVRWHQAHNVGVCVYRPHARTRAKSPQPGDFYINPVPMTTSPENSREDASGFWPQIHTQWTVTFSVCLCIGAS